MPTSDEPFEVRGINHFALVCSDIDRTVDFYSRVLGFPLVKTLELPNGSGKHFFFDIGVGTGPQLGFFWFADGPEAAPGVAAPAGFPGQMIPGRKGQIGGMATAVGSMNHLAFDVPEDKLEEYRERLKRNDIKCTRVINHDDTPQQFSQEKHAGVHTRSIYFFDPDGIMLEFASWVRDLTDEDVGHGKTAEDELPTVASELARSSNEEARRVDGGAPFS